MVSGVNSVRYYSAIGILWHSATRNRSCCVVERRCVYAAKLVLLLVSARRARTYVIYVVTRACEYRCVIITSVSPTVVEFVFLVSR